MLWACHTGANQRWTLTAAGELRIYGDLKCLDADQNGTEPGTSLVIWDCHTGANQKWYLNANGTITGVQSGLCITATGTANGSAVVLSTCGGTASQTWTRA
jgi:hypothetical protein